MKRFIIATDSGCDLPLSKLEERDIRALRIQYELDGAVVDDTMLHEDCKAFYERMRNGAAPRTSQINTERFTAFWRELAKEGLPIVHISLGSGISGTYYSGMQAAEQLKTELPNASIHLIDSTLASVGYGMLALKAADMRDAGETPEACVDFLNAHKAEINTYYTTSDLTYLYRSGRVSRTGMAVAHALGICPILNLDLEGHLIVQERVRGVKATLRRIDAIVQELVVRPEEQVLYICHSDIPEQARAFGDGLKERHGFKDVYYTYIGTTIGAHSGPGLMAAFFFGKPRTMKGYKGK